MEGSLPRAAGDASPATDRRQAELTLGEGQTNILDGLRAEHDRLVGDMGLPLVQVPYTGMGFLSSRYAGVEQTVMLAADVSANGSGHKPSLARLCELWRWEISSRAARTSMLASTRVVRSPSMVKRPW